MNAAPPQPTADDNGPLMPQALRAALGRFATGVTIITCLDTQGGAVGLTANSFASLSLDPPLVLWSLRKASGSRAAFEVARHFAINVLAETQVDLSRRFASAAVPDKFAEGAWAPGLGCAGAGGLCGGVRMPGRRLPRHRRPFAVDRPSAAPG